MMRSLFSAISGMRSHQNWMDVIGNNIANVNTTGFKVGRVRFQDVMSQTLRGATGPQEGQAGTNPMQIGLGVVVGGVDTVQTQGALQATGKISDLAIQGDGFFIVNNGNQTLFTRDGGFDIGSDGRLVNTSSGMYLMGWQADNTGNVDTAGPLTSIIIPMGQQLDAQATTQVRAQGNLDAGTANGGTYATRVAMFDSLGFRHELTLTYTKTADNTWNWEYGSDDPGVTIANATGTIEFDGQGKVLTVTSPGDLTVTFDNGADALIVPNGGDFNVMTQLSNASSATAVGNGAAAGSLMSFAASTTGEILGLYSNGTSKVLGQLGTATFTNPGGMVKSGSNMYVPTANSGEPVIGTPGGGGQGSIASGYLEMSNVDLAQEFTSMIMANRGFQANSRVITTSDEVLQELVNLKR